MGTAIAALSMFVGLLAVAVLFLLAARGVVLWFWRITDILIELQGLRERLDRTNALLETGIRVWPQTPRPPAPASATPAQTKEKKP